ncbi:MAG TPA: AMP-binding protein, partial [Burkholderiaceae bacterium]|nr:AMP-binding protein [Burkholderiaceae bacterium]
IRNLRLYVLDAKGQPVPIGVAGDIHVGGAGVGRGYLHRPELNAERFAADPFVDDPAARMYKTGDLGRWLPDGRIEYLGRDDTQVKLRGFRVELGEIEARLAAVVGGHDVAAMVREDAPGGQRLVAYYTGEPRLPGFLRARLLVALPDYMVPVAYVRMERLPLSPNGKLDRDALPAPAPEALALRPYEAPQGPAETVLAGIWRDLLALDQVGRDDHFFELGGHSLMVVTLIDRLHAQGLRAEVRDVFAAPRLADMAAAIAAAGPAPAGRLSAEDRGLHGCDAPSPDMLPLVRLRQDELDRIAAGVPGGAPNVQDIYPLSPLQEGILFHHLLDREADAYVVRSVLSFDDRGRLDAFLDALQQVIDRHDILRSCVRWQDLPQAVQVVCRRARLPVHTLALPAGGDALAELLAQTDPRRTRIDLQQAPLLAAHIGADPASGHWLLSLLNHHMVSDHLTLEFVLAEIQAILGGEAARLAAPRPYRDFIAHMRAEPAAAHEDYFRRLLGDVEEPTAAFGLLDVQGDGALATESRTALGDGLARRVREAARRHGVTTAVLFHLAWAQVLAQGSGRDDVVFGSVLSGRLQGIEGAGRALGVFINTLPVRLCLGDRPVGALLRDTYRQLTELLQHEQASLALAQRCSAVPASMPLFTALLNYRHHAGTDGLPDASGSPLAAWHGIRILHSEERSNYPLTLSVEDDGRGLGLTVQAVPPVSPVRIQDFVLRAVEQLIDALEHAPHTPVHQLDVLPAAERERVLHTWNQTESDCPDELLIHQMFEQQVQRAPDAVAVVAENGELSYAGLNHLANGLARRLVGLGARPDERVAICMERGVNVVVALMGVLKAGAAYVPIDPAYPADRLGRILADANPVLLLSDAAGRAALGSAAAGIAGLDFDTLPRYVGPRSPQTAPAPRGGSNCAWGGPAHSCSPILPEQNLDPRTLGLRSEHLAYVIYTSGSTGRPKGVMIEHRSLVVSTAARQAVYPPSPDRRFMLLSSIAFDSSVAGLFGTLCSGGTLYLPSQAVATDPQAIARALTPQRITSLLCVPSLARLVLAGLAVPGTGTLREMIVAGEACPPALVQEAAAHPGLALYNEYGP